MRPNSGSINLLGLFAALRARTVQRDTSIPTCPRAGPQRASRATPEKAWMDSRSRLLLHDRRSSIIMTVFEPNASSPAVTACVLGGVVDLLPAKA